MKIVQITSVVSSSEGHFTIGLGDDGKVYFWDRWEGKWVLDIRQKS